MSAFSLASARTWYHLAGTSALTCISGFCADRKLTEHSSTYARRTLWKEQHPDTKYLKS